jgi:hypothetical protein
MVYGTVEGSRAVPGFGSRDAETFDSATIESTN